jgi:hypothetical protein
MRHNQYREGLLERLRTWRVANVDATIAQARNEFRKSLSNDDIDLLFDNWLNANYDRIEVVSRGPHSHTAVIKSRATTKSETPEQRAATKARRDVIASRIVTGVKDSLFESFAARIWETVLPNGTVLRDATGKDLKHATGWFAEVSRQVKSTEKVVKKLTTKQLFNISQRFS